MTQALKITLTIFSGLLEDCLASQIPWQSLFVFLSSLACSLQDKKLKTDTEYNKDCCITGFLSETYFAPAQKQVRTASPLLPLETSLS